MYKNNKKLMIKYVLSTVLAAASAVVIGLIVADAILDMKRKNEEEQKMIYEITYVIHYSESHRDTMKVRSNKKMYITAYNGVNSIAEGSPYGPSLVRTTAPIETIYYKRVFK